MVNCCVYLVGIITLVRKVFPIFLKMLKGNKQVRLLEENYEKDVVYLFQFPGTPTASSVSPYCIKVEAFCRLYGISFERRNTLSARGANGRLPFIELNGERHSDSQMIIKRLTQIFNIKTYPDEQTAAIGHTVDRFLDNHTSKLVIMAKLSLAGENIRTIGKSKGVPDFLLPILTSLGGFIAAKRKSKRATAAIGVFEEHEYLELLRNDLIQLQTILGTKKYLMGEEPTAVDCTAFCHFGSSFYLHELLESSDFLPLKEYIERTKIRIFGDEFCDI